MQDEFNITNRVKETDFSAVVKGRDGGERLADEWLAKAPFDKECPAYVEHYLMRDKIVRRGEELSLDEAYERFGIEVPAVADLFEVAWSEIMAGANKVRLNWRQIYIMRLRKAGMSYRDIAAEIEDMTGSPVSYSTVRRDLIRAAERIQAIPEFGVWTVLAEAFGQEIGWVRDILRRR